jgi:signal transduction histidine kinase
MKLRTKILGINLVALVGVLAAVIFITSPLITSSQGSESLLLFISIMLSVGFVSIMISTLLLEAMVIRRISDLTSRVNHIKDYRSYYEELNYAGQDEVATLAKATNQMLQRIVSSTNEVGRLNARLQEEKSSIEKTVARRTEQLNAEKARLKASVSNLSLGFIMTDAQNNIIILNDPARHILATSASGSERAAAEHRDWTITAIDEAFGSDFALLEKLAQSTRTGESADYTDVGYAGHILRILVNPVLENHQAGMLGCVIVLEDVTEQKVLERSRDEFFSIASHELRTPLTAIRGNTALIKQFYEEKVKDPSFDEMVDDIHGASVRLIRIVNDFLDVSRLEQGKITFKIEPFDLSEVTESVIYETGSIADEKGNHILMDKTLKVIPRVLADKDRVKQIVYNLVGNAMKFTENGSITIGAHKEGNLIKVTVTDTGIGIAEENQKLLFHKFQQAGTDAFTRETSRGTGLGLYISKLLVNRMGGAIALEHSELGVGTTLSFTLPAVTE